MPLSQRHQQIISLLKENKIAYVKDLAEYFNITEASIRSDLNELENAGFIRRFHGGAKILESEVFSSRLSKNKALKKQIALRALNFVESGQTIFLDSGTTVLTLARELAIYDNLTVVTNSFPVANLIASDKSNRVIFIGGIYNYQEQCCEGSITEESLNSIYTAVSFIGADAINIDNGLLSSNLDRIGYMRRVLELSKLNILLVDSSKFGKVGAVKIVDIDAIDIIITDSKIPKEYVDRLNSSNIRVEIVD
ncbi:MAG: hypothetical protein B5M53_11535 [Candidatus Cloacimonas sp. 4484_209]|nr:MAG: hypothetical protein B5M53_11535 [Candidatus Cloacimonas sp. 4484_209]